MLLNDLIDPFVDLRGPDWGIISVMVIFTGGFLYLIAITAESAITWIISLFVS